MNFSLKIDRKGSDIFLDKHIPSKFSGKTLEDVVEKSRQSFRPSIRYKIATIKRSDNARMRDTPLHFMNG